MGENLKKEKEMNGKLEKNESDLRQEIKKMNENYVKLEIKLKTANK